MADTRIFDEATFRNAVTHFEVNKDPASAQRIVTGAGAILWTLDKARTDLEDAQGNARTFHLNWQAHALRASAVRAVAADLHEPGCPVDGTLPDCPGCRVLTAVNGDEQDGDDRG